MKSGTAAVVLCGLSVAALIAGPRACSHARQGGAPQAPPSAGAGAHQAARPRGSTGTGSVAGTVRYRGPPIAASPIAASRPSGLAVSGCEGRVPQAALQLAGDRVGSAFIFVREGLPPGEYPVPEEPLALDQQGCEFSPRVFGIRRGQPLLLINDDPTLHNVHALGEGGGLLSRGANAFNVAMPVQHGRVRRAFDAPQTMVTVVCDVHPWMHAYAGVLEHPFFAVSGGDGAYRISGLPEGRFVVEAWQERLGRTSGEVVVPPGGTAVLDLAWTP